MKQLSKILLLLLIIGIAAGQSCVEVFDEEHFQGNRLTVCKGILDIRGKLKKIHSVRFPKEVFIKLYSLTGKHFLIDVSDCCLTAYKKAKFFAVEIYDRKTTQPIILASQEQKELRRSLFHMSSQNKKYSRIKNQSHSKYIN